MKMNEEPDIIHMELLFDKKKQSPEQYLFLSVVLQALLDVTKTVQSNKDSHYKARAKAWFFCSVGVTCDNFERVCFMAGINPEKTRSFAYKVIDSNYSGNFKTRIKNLLGEVDADKRKT